MRSLPWLALVAVLAVLVAAGGAGDRTGSDDRAMAHVVETSPGFTPGRILPDGAGVANADRGLWLQGATGLLLFVFGCRRARSSAARTR